MALEEQRTLNGAEGQEIVMHETAIKKHLHIKNGHGCSHTICFLVSAVTNITQTVVTGKKETEDVEIRA